jgi:hypothetical protein
MENISTENISHTTFSQSNSILSFTKWFINDNNECDSILNPLPEETSHCGIV